MGFQANNIIINIRASSTPPSLMGTHTHTHTHTHTCTYVHTPTHTHICTHRYERGHSGAKTVKITTGIKLLENHNPQETLLFSSFLPRNPYLETKLWSIVSLKRLGQSTYNLAHKFLFIRTFDGMKIIETREGHVNLQEYLKIVLEILCLTTAAATNERKRSLHSLSSRLWLSTSVGRWRKGRACKGGENAKLKQSPQRHGRLKTATRWDQFEIKVKKNGLNNSCTHYTDQVSQQWRTLRVDHL